MAQERILKYNIYDVLPDRGGLEDVFNDTGSDAEGGVLGSDGGGASPLTDVPNTLIETGKVTLGEEGIEVESDTSLDSYTPNLDEHEVTHDLAFTVTDKDTVSWGSGTIYVGDEAGTSYAIDAGNTGNMAARTYIFLDTAVSETVLQTTTTVSGTVGPNRKLIAVAQNGSAQAIFQVYGGIGGLKLPAASVSISNNNWQFSGTWSVTDADTVAWGAGTLTTSDGGSYAISGGNTGNMASKTFIYFDLAVSSTAFQTTTTAANSVGDGKILIAVAQNATVEAKYIVMNDFQLNIDAGSIVAGSITANEIAAGAITAAKMNVSSLSAIVADLGSITAGTITLNTAGYIKGGQSGYDTGTGFFLGYSGGAYKFSIGTPGTASLTWDGTTLSASNMELAYPFTAKEAITAGDAVAIIPPAGVRDTALAKAMSGITESTYSTAAGQPPQAAIVFTTSADAVGLSYIKLVSSSYPYAIYDSAGAHPSGAGWTLRLWDDVNEVPTGSSLVSGNMSGSAPFFTFGSTGIISLNVAVSPNTKYCFVYFAKSWGSNSGQIRCRTSASADSGDAADPVLWVAGITSGAFEEQSQIPTMSWMEKVWGSDAGQLVKASAVDALDGRYLGYIGIAKENIAAAGVGDVKTFGISSAESGLTIGSDYYLSDTLGDISTSAGTTSKVVGKALTTSLLLLQ